MSVTDPILPAGAVEFDPFSEAFFNDPSTPTVAYAMTNRLARLRTAIGVAEELGYSSRTLEAHAPASVSTYSRYIATLNRLGLMPASWLRRCRLGRLESAH